MLVHPNHPRNRFPRPCIFQKPCLWVTEKSQPGRARTFQRAVAVCVAPSEAEEVASFLNGEGRRRKGKKKSKGKRREKEKLKRKGRRVNKIDFRFSSQMQL